MDDPILRRLPDMQQSAQPGAKVTLPSINQVAGAYGRDAAGAADQASARGTGGGAGPGPVLGSEAAPSEAAQQSQTPRPLVQQQPVQPRRQSPQRSPQPGALQQPQSTLLGPKTRAYSTAAAGSADNGSAAPQVLAGLAKRRHSSGTPAPVSAATLAAAKPSATAKARSKSTSLSARAKQRAQSFTYGEPGAAAANGKPLNTHSPIAVAAAAAVTSDKISKLLIAQGPLPIRHITSHLAATIPGFGELSLSKQRRLIIAVLDAPRSDFVKVGWGRWAVRGHTTDSAAHRESISSQLPDTKPPLSPGLRAVEDSAVFSDSEDESDGGDDLEGDRLDDEIEGTDEEDWRAMGPASLRQTSPREQDAIAALVQLRSE